MTSITWPGNLLWPTWQKIIFRFLFIYLSLLVVPWIVTNLIPNYDYHSSLYSRIEGSIVNAANQFLFHTYKKLSTEDTYSLADSSYGWTCIRLFLIVAFIATIIWTITDKKSKNYNFLSYWFRILLRYFLIEELFGYGIDKIFHLQMPYPGIAQLATPIGDHFGEGLLWLSMGYATKYQIFTGIVETVAGVLMLFRRTVTFGTLIALATFVNIFMINIGYDIEVKLISLHLVIMCMVLLAFEYKRIIGFVLMNSTVLPANLYDVRFSQKWVRVGAIVVQSLFIWQVFIMQFYNDINRLFEIQRQFLVNPLRPGVYNVTSYKRNGNALPPLLTDSLRWEKIIFNDWGNWGYVNPYDSLFTKRLSAGFFTYNLDTVRHEIQFMKTSADHPDPYPSFLMKYEFPDSNTILLSGIIQKDTVSAILKKAIYRSILTNTPMTWLKDNGYYQNILGQ